ncbi:MAG: hypothetical protein RR309_11270 [Cellulosilyticaceae bacterium]
MKLYKHPSSLAYRGMSHRQKIRNALIAGLSALLWKALFACK